MRMRITSLAFLIGICGSSGCTFFRTPVMPPPGYGFTGYAVPVDTTFHDTQATGREGHSSVKNFFGLFGWGDASVTAAARNGGLTTVDQIDCKVTFILFGLYSEYETIVTGK